MPEKNVQNTGIPSFATSIEAFDETKHADMLARNEAHNDEDGMGDDE
ncbi:MAG: hypothetical protein ACK5JF_02860 [Oscillospiraceae bacterium]